ncbi:hypothetical protein SAY87_018267 [Trapa incisa]|uniref:MADS-box domain-containing protein n=1 Tax=Trapa incisa TaxID=236973 RepID=A0AAN7L3R7_9MYRT|nr:hypothetical protein SAY87_018267 [Trapa incisa]
MVSQVPSKRLSQGRRNIEIKKREKIEGRRVTFMKRRIGLFDKVVELCILCEVNVMILTFLEGWKAFFFDNPDVEFVMEGYLTKWNLNR